MAFEIGSLSAETTIRNAQTSRPAGNASAKIVAIRGDRQDLAGESQPLPAVDARKEAPVVASREQLQDTVAKANELPPLVRRSLEFTLDEEYGRPIITIRDIETEAVIRQIPPEEIVAFSKYLRELAENEGEKRTGLVVRLEA